MPPPNRAINSVQTRMAHLSATVKTDMCSWAIAVKVGSHEEGKNNGIVSIAITHATFVHTKIWMSVRRHLLTPN